MGIPSVRRCRFGRALFVLLALVANLVATGVPLLHALAHEHGHGHREAHAQGHEHAHEGDHAPSRHGEEHDEIHPASLHDEWLVVPRAGLDFAAALIPGSSLEPIALLVVVAPFLAASALHSRAPPRTTPARAPPHV
jgi:hypothetical protein